MKKSNILLLITFLFTLSLSAQTFKGKESTPDEGDEYVIEKIVLEDGDTIFMEVLPEMIVTPLRMTEKEELIWQYYNKKVFNKKNTRRERFLNTRKPDFLLSSVYKRKLKKKPELYEYAARAVKAYDDFIIETEGKSDKEKKKYAKKKKKEIKKEYDPKELRTLTKMEGRLLIKMVEYTTDKTFFDILTELRGPGNAKYWETMTKTFKVGTLKEGFNPAEYPVMNKAFKQENVASKIAAEMAKFETKSN